MAQAQVNQDDIITGLRGLGLRAGELVFIHASLSRFGHVVGGPRAVIEALLAVVGPAGTLAMPAFTFGQLHEPRPVLDLRHSPCWVGKVYELFRTEYATHRSRHVTHSVAAAGPLAAALTADHGPTPFGPTSPFVRLAERHGTLLLMGVGHNSNTTMHAVEETAALAYCQMRENREATVVDEEGVEHHPPMFLHAPTRRYDFNRLNASLVAAGLQREAFIGDSLVRAVDAGAMFAHALAAVQRDPEALLWLDEERVQIPVGRVEGQTVYA
jgi:aminoglycoside 3-N-acetyltransferase